MRGASKMLWETLSKSFKSKSPVIAVTLIGLLGVVTLMNGCGLPPGLFGDLSRPGSFSSHGVPADETGFDGKAFVYFSTCADGNNVADRILYSNDGSRVKYIRKDCDAADLTILASELQEYQIGELSYRTHRGKSFEEESRQIVRTNLRDSETILRCHYSDAQTDGELVLLRNGRGSLAGRGAQNQAQSGEGIYAKTLLSGNTVGEYSIAPSPVGFEIQVPNPLPRYQVFLAVGEIESNGVSTPVNLNCYASE